MTEKKKKSLKGMTLMEIIISIAVMAIVSMIIVMAGVSAVYHLKVAHSVSEKNAQQSPYASAKLGDETTKKTLKLDLQVAGGMSDSIEVDAYEVGQAESSSDKLGNYRYFVNP